MYTIDWHVPVVIICKETPRYIQVYQYNACVWLVCHELNMCSMFVKRTILCPKFSALLNTSVKLLIYIEMTDNEYFHQVDKRWKTTARDRLQFQGHGIHHGL